MSCRPIDSVSTGASPSDMSLAAAESDLSSHPLVAGFAAAWAVPSLEGLLRLFTTDVVLRAPLTQWGRLCGTASGEFLGQPPTGRAIDIAMSAIYDFRDDSIISERVYLDLATMAAQAGWDLGGLRAALGLDGEAKR